jgi:hypothetical protein
VSVCRGQPDLFVSLGPWSRADARLVLASFLPLQLPARDVSAPSPAQPLPFGVVIRGAAALAQTPAQRLGQLYCRSYAEAILCAALLASPSASRRVDPWAARRVR